MVAAAGLPHPLADEPPFLAFAALLDVGGDQTWRYEAACRGRDTNWFYPARGQDTRRQRKVCEQCAVREPCLDYALTSESTAFGIWGGSSGRDRRRARRQGLSAAQLLAELG